MKNRYKCEMDRLTPRKGKLEEMYAMMEGETTMKQVKGISRRTAAVALVCILLTVTATAAAIPAIWEALMGHLGVFAPYSQTVRGASCQDQGIKVQVLSALADDLEGRFFLSVQDVEGDRLNEHLTLDGRLENGEAVPDKKDNSVGVFSFNDRFEVVSYDAESKTALFSIDILYFEEAQPTRNARLSLSSMTTRNGTIKKYAPLASIPGGVLKSLPVGETDQTIFSPSDFTGFTYTDAVLPREQVVLAPEQNPMPLEGTDDMWISSMGFASDGCFHIRLGFVDGISVVDGLKYPWFHATLELNETDEDKCMTYRETVVPGGIDILFPLFHAEDLALLQNGSVYIYGDYTRPGTKIEGDWEIDFQVEYFPSAVLDWTGELAGRQVTRVTLSPLSVTMNSNDWGRFSTSTLYAVKRDGSTVAAKPGTCTYHNIAAGTGKAVWDAYNTWKFEGPVDPEELAGLSLMGVTIPVD